MAGKGVRLTMAVAVLAMVGTTAAEAEILAIAGGAAQPAVRFAAPFGTEDRAEDEIDGIGVDNAGNTYVTGVMRDRLAVGGQTLVSRGEGDVFLASLDANGGLRWLQQFGGAGDDNAYDLAVDGQGNIVISGWFAGSVNFGGTTLQSQGSLDMFVAKYAPNGGLLWARSFGGPQGDGGNEVAVTSGGEIAVAALTEGGMNFDGSGFSAGGGERDSYLVRLGPDGQLRWVYPFNGPGTERIRAVTMNETGEVFVGFQFRGSLQFGSQALGAQGGWDGAIAKIGSDGSAAWVLPVASGGEDNVRGLGAAPDGSVYASGAISGSGVLFDQQIPGNRQRGGDYLVRLSGDGQSQWIVSVLGRGTIGPELEADSRGVLISAALGGEAVIRHNRDVLARVTPPSGLPTSYLAGFSPNGALRFVYSPSPEGRGSGARGNTLAVSTDGRFVAQVIYFRGSLGFSGQTLQTPGRVDSALVLLDLNGT